MAAEEENYLGNQYLLCILTSKRVLQKAFSGLIINFGVFTFLSDKNGKSRKSAKNKEKYTKKGVYQNLGATLECWLTPICRLTHGENLK